MANLNLQEGVLAWRVLDLGMLVGGQLVAGLRRSCFYSRKHG
jgi:hypothetical protein